ncbi:MAG: hypothetical protein HZA46_01415 [Planctomycetales bacterium]|nr:hypothetical protein [Planctomycetales bacterium]
MRRVYVSGVGLALSVATILSLSAIVATVARADDKAKFTIAEVMKKAHGGSKLANKVADGKASKEDKEMLLDLYKALASGKPSKGDAKSWKEKTEALVAAAESAVKGDADAGEKLTKAKDCKSCHMVHK